MKLAIVLVLMSSPVFAQAPQTAASGSSASCGSVSLVASGFEFDAASIKLSGPPVPGAHMGITGGPASGDPGRVSMRWMSLSHLFAVAYGLGGNQIVSEGWMDDFASHGFDVTATMPGTTTKEQYCGMLRNLLTNHFHLSFHRMSKTRASYDLVVRPEGPKFGRYSPDTDAVDLRAIRRISCPLTSRGHSVSTGTGLFGFRQRKGQAPEPS